MFSIESCSIPDGALLHDYLGAGTYTDCYVTEICGSVSHAQYVMAFYTTLVFKLERLILKIAVSRPSTDAQAKQLAAGSIDVFSAWHVEARAENQLLLSDFHRRTRSWLMVVPMAGVSGTRTRLYFGSAVFQWKMQGQAGLHLGSVFVPCSDFTDFTRWCFCTRPGHDWRHNVLERVAVDSTLKCNG